MTRSAISRPGATRPLQAVGALLLACSAVVALLSASAAPARGTTATGASDAGGPVVDLLRVGGAIDPSMVRYLDRALDDAAALGAEVTVVEVSSPGLLDVELDDLLEVLEGREVPVVVWVGPPGARATGGAAWLAAAADAVALAPGAVLGGAASPRLDDVGPPTRGADVAAADEQAPAVRAGQWLETRGLLDGAVVATVDPAATVPDDVALPAGLTVDDLDLRLDAELVDAGIVDHVAVELDDVLREIDGTTVTLPSGEEHTLDVDPVTAQVRFDNQGLWGRMLHAVADPVLAYLLLVAGLAAVAFELFQPGFGVAGLAGIATAALGTYGLAVLPTRPLMAVLVVAGFALLSLDTAVGGLGFVTAAGAIALGVGSARLYGGSPDLALPGWLVGLVVVAALVYFVGVLTTVLRAQGQQMRAGAAQITGQLGVVRSVLNPEGHVFVGGALWRARAPEDLGTVRTGTTVRVLGTSDGLTLDVEVVENAGRAPVAQASS